ncbi:MAG: hypothetical protein L0Y55_01620 [Anaerolineales bacterium]|nr:hypothetical protein [Anaerolineales bacterium]
MNTIVELLQRRIWIGPLIGLIIGIGLGLLIGWVVAPVNWQPNADDVVAVADSYSLNNDPVLARARLKNLPRADQERLLKTLIQDRTAKGLTREVERLNNLAQVLNIPIIPGAVATPVAGIPPVATSIVTRPVGATTPVPASAFDPGSIITIVLIALALVLVAAGIAILVLRILPSLRSRRGARPTATAASGAAAPPTYEGERLGSPMPSPPATTTPGGLGRFVPSYTLGNDNYDTSYSLETGRGEFLGECGMGISETIGEGKPDKVIAFDLWLFDKADVRTVTQILMSEHAFKDQTLRTKLATKGEAIQVEKGKTLHFETASLRVDAQIVELVYATNPNYPPNSHFQKLLVEIVPSLKTDGGTAR